MGLGIRFHPARNGLKTVLRPIAPAGLQIPQGRFGAAHSIGGAFLLVFLVLAGTPAFARTSNGNDFALFLSEAKDPRDEKLLLEDAMNRPHYFRYLQIMEMVEIEVDGRKSFRITAFEPASLMDVKFSISKSVSIAKLREDPVSKIGSAIAVTGKVIAANRKQNTIALEGTIVRHKDRLSPKIGKELLCEVEPGAVFYNYTGGSRPVTLTYKDRDLIRHKERIVGEKGPDGWVEFLEREKGKRKKERDQAGSKAGSGGGNP